MRSTVVHENADPDGGDPIRETASGRLPAVVLLGGEANALSVGRSLHRTGVRVYAVGRAGSRVRHSRRIGWLGGIPAGAPAEDWLPLLASRRLDGAVLLAGSDDGLELILRNRDELLRRFVLDLSNPEAQRIMLDKLATYEAARDAGLDTPRFWSVSDASDLKNLRDALIYPLIVKPRLSHRFQARFTRRKFFVAHDFAEAGARVAQALSMGLDVLLVEKIPGGDDQLCSYYTYIDERGRHLFHFTKRIIRRFPRNMGPATCHTTALVPELRPLAEKLFRHVDLRGLANVEFLRDERDGSLKLIECNARFTAANQLVADAGYDLGRFVYRRLTGGTPQSLGPFRAGLGYWYPLDDFRAFLALRAERELTFGSWLRSVRHVRTLPFFAWDDPLPSWLGELDRLRRAGRARYGNGATGVPAGTAAVTP